MVVGNLRQWRNDGSFHLRLLVLLLLPSKWNEGILARILLLWLHVRLFIRLLLDAWKRRIPIQFVVCPIHLQSNQVRLEGANRTAFSLIILFDVQKIYIILKLHVQNLYSAIACRWPID